MELLQGENHRHVESGPPIRSAPDDLVNEEHGSMTGATTTGPGSATSESLHTKRSSSDSEPSQESKRQRLSKSPLTTGFSSPLRSTTVSNNAGGMRVYETLSREEQRDLWKEGGNPCSEASSKVDLKVYVGRLSTKEIRDGVNHEDLLRKHFGFLQQWDYVANGQCPDRLDPLSMTTETWDEDVIEAYITAMLQEKKQGELRLDLHGLRACNVAFAPFLLWSNGVDKGEWHRRDSTLSGPSEFAFQVLLRLNDRLGRSDDFSVEFVMANFDGLTVNPATPAWLHKCFPNLDIRLTMLFSEQQERLLNKYVTESDLQGLACLPKFLQKTTLGVYALSVNMRGLDFVQSGSELTELDEWNKHRMVLCFWRLGLVDNMRKLTPRPFPDTAKFSNSRTGYPRGRFWGDATDERSLLAPLASTKASTVQVSGWALNLSRSTTHFEGLTEQALDKQEFWASVLYKSRPEVLCRDEGCYYMTMSEGSCVLNGSDPKQRKPRPGQLTKKTRETLLAAGRSPYDCEGCVALKRQAAKAKTAPPPECEKILAACCSNCARAGIHCVTKQKRQIDQSSKKQAWFVIADNPPPAAHAEHT